MIDESTSMSIDGLKAYEAGACDVLRLPSTMMPEVIEQVQRQHAGEYVEMTALGTWYVGFDVRDPPFDDDRVRRHSFMRSIG